RLCQCRFRQTRSHSVRSAAVRKTRRPAMLTCSSSTGGAQGSARKLQWHSLGRRHDSFHGGARRGEIGAEL
ncbi:MAG: hypothetical protein IKT45_06070, partial [Lachnospiraceae bacterium]|nr:hypothetical protein [Lachnospiraceae bacterium]